MIAERVGRVWWLIDSQPEIYWSSSNGRITVRRATTVFGISGTVPFLNVNVDSDNQLFLDPSAIRNGKDRYSIRAHRALVEFFEEILTCARGGAGPMHRKGEHLLQEMGERNETRLGYSAGPPKGHGFGDTTGSYLWNAILSNRTLGSGIGGSTSIHQAVLSRLERVPLFVSKVGVDMMSDLVTHVILHVLADFNAEMMARYPKLKASSVMAELDVWDSSSANFVEKSLEFPAVDGSVLVLVPKGWVYWRFVMDPEAFYNRYSTSVIQQQQSSIGSDGKTMAPTKQAIKAANPDKRLTNVKKSTEQAELNLRDLAGEYQREIDADFAPLDDTELDARLQD